MRRRPILATVAVALFLAIAINVAGGIARLGAQSRQSAEEDTRWLSAN